jgi:hypothetical protein
VQVQLQLLPAAAPVARIQAAEQLSITQLLEQYAANTGMQEEVLLLARSVLKVQGAVTAAAAVAAAGAAAVAATSCWCCCSQCSSAGLIVIV